jgi:hypothetical protein
MSVQTSDVASRYPAPTIRPKGRPFTIAAFVCAGLALLFALLAAIPGIVLGIVGLVKGDRPLAGWAIAACVLGAVLGMALGLLLVNSSDRDAAAVLVGFVL